MQDEPKQVQADQDVLHKNQTNLAACASDALKTLLTLTPNSNAATIKEMATVMAKTMTAEIVQSQSNNIATAAAKAALKEMQLSGGTACPKADLKTQTWQQWKF